MARRGRVIPADAWFVQAAQRLLKDDNRGLVELGKDLAKLAQRSAPFSHTMLSRFINSEASITQELAEAIMRMYFIPAPVFFARTPEEAYALQNTARSFDGHVSAMTVDQLVASAKKMVRFPTEPPKAAPARPASRTTKRRASSR